MFAREWWILLTSALLSLTLTPLAARLAVRLEMFDRPDPRKLHSEPTPLLGGLAIYLAFLFSIGLLAFFVFFLLLVLFLARVPYEAQDPLMGKSTQKKPHP